MTRASFVINSRGEKEPFSFGKVYGSARKVGASKELAGKIAEIVGREAYPGIKTFEIFRKVRRMLNREIPKAALRFNLKKAMRELGPTGFPFEKYIGEIFSRQGFKVKLNQNVPGRCLRYEIDFLARKDNLLYIGECKYRNSPEGIVHSDIALSSQARFLDIKSGNILTRNGYDSLQLKSILVTNNRFSKDAIKFSRCAGNELLGWKYPKNEGLEYLIDRQNLYPITTLPSLGRELASVFVARGMMLAEDVLKINPMKFAQEMGVSEESLKPLIREARILLE